jgi:hypothetical protein
MFTVFKAYAPVAREYRWHQVGILLMIAFTVVTIALRPFAYEELTVVFTQPTRNPSAAYAALWKLGVLLLLGWIGWRCVDIMLVKFEAGACATWRSSRSLLCKNNRCASLRARRAER